MQPLTYRYLHFLSLQGCKAGCPTYSFRYIKDNDGVDTETSYPYEAEEDHCAFSTDDVGDTLSGFGMVTPGDEEAMRHAILKYVSKLEVSLQ